MSVNAVNSDGSLLRVAGGTLWADSPIGTILPYGGATAPSGWMICDGASLLRASYPELFAVIGTAFGSADSTHFNIPDMRESVPKGAGLTGHTVGAHLDADGLAVGEFLDDRIQEHNHGINFTSSGSGNLYSVNFSENKSSNYNYTIISNARDRSGATTEVKAVGVNYIIKAKMVALPADFLSAVDEAVEEMCTDTVTSGSTAPITSGGVYDYIGSLSGVTQVGDWKLIRLGSSDLYLGLYYHNNITPDKTMYYVPLPNGYSCIEHYFGQCFQEGYTQNVTGATHTGGNEYAMVIYFTGGPTGNVYEVRACCLFQRNS